MYTRVNEPYIEEDENEKMVFTRWVKKVDPVKLYDIGKLSKMKQIEYCYMRKNLIQISEVIKIESDRLLFRVWYPIYTILK